LVDFLQNNKKNLLVTPIEVEKYSNGVRILFRPFVSSYLSSKEEKQNLIEESSAKDETLPKIVTKRKGGYLSPEDEEKLSKASNQAVSNSKVLPIKAKAIKPEGGLEIIVDVDPFLRVRIKRCNMGPTTIVKEESEATILKEIDRFLTTAENDYRILINAEKNNSKFEF
jgi:hypothetical protein